MRKGENPNRDKVLPKDGCYHKVIIPLYIPQEEGYYRDSFAIFKLCIQSLRKTSTHLLNIAVASNGSDASVNEKLVALQKEGAINELFITPDNIGKINSILRLLSGATERLITICDADVLFLNGWEERVIDVFKAFPKAGSVSPVPLFRKQSTLTANIWRDFLFSKRLRFTRVKNPEAMTLFAKSIGWSRLDDQWKDVILSLHSKEGMEAVVGSGHFVATYKNEVFQQLPKKASGFTIGGDSEIEYTDKPVLKQGGYRLATADNHAYHLGNVLEPWMQELFDNLYDEKKTGLKSELRVLHPASSLQLFKNKLMFKILATKPLYRWLLKKKGLNTTQINYFTGK